MHKRVVEEGVRPYCSVVLRYCSVVILFIVMVVVGITAQHSHTRLEFKKRRVQRPAIFTSASSKAGTHASDRFTNTLSGPSQPRSISASLEPKRAHPTQRCRKPPLARPRTCHPSHQAIYYLSQHLCPRRTSAYAIHTCYCTVHK